MMARAVALSLIVLATSLACAPTAASATPSAPSAVTPQATSTSTVNQIVSAAGADVQAFWRQTFPDLYGGRYEPVRPSSVIAATRGTKLPTCQGAELSYRDVVGNAFYCFRDNFIVYDAQRLFPAIAENFGEFSVALVVAHEWGHAIQDRADNAEQPTILKELQADCFAGAWTADQAGAKSGPVLHPGDLESSLAALLQFRDTPGTSPDDSSAHGSAFDRVNAFQEGFDSGVERCAAYFDKPPVIVELPFASDAEAENGGEVAAEDVIPLAVQLLNDFYTQVDAAFTPVSIDAVGGFDSSDSVSIPKCGTSKPPVKQVRNRVYYCIPDDYIAFDQPFLQQIYDEIGDFGAASLVASPFATRLQSIQGEEGVESNDLAIVFQADCYTGGFTAAFSNGYLSGSLSPGDLDELVEAFLVYSRARGVSAKVPLTFLRMDYFRRGFFDGYNSCDLATIQDEVAKL